MKVLDVDFKDRDGDWILRFRYNGKLVQTRLGRLHNNITQRANKEGSLQNLHTKSYQGVEISSEFKDAQKFCEWAVNQIGWGNGFHLDKDLLKPGNRVYCSDYCVFIPDEINFNIRPKYSDNNMLIGVHINKNSGKFFSSVGIKGKDKYLGSFDTEIEAHIAYKVAKEHYIKELANNYKYVIDHRAYEALMQWKVQDCYDNGVAKLAA